MVMVGTKITTKGNQMSRTKDPMRQKRPIMIPISWKIIHGIRNPALP